MRAATFEFSAEADPLVAASPDKFRPVLTHASIQRCRHPLTGERGVYLVTTDSYIAAFIPVAAKHWRGRKPQLVPAAAVKAALEMREPQLVLERDGRIGANGTSFALPELEHQPPDATKIIPDFSGEWKEPAPQFAINPALLNSLGQALGARLARRVGGRPAKPLRLTIRKPLSPLVAQPEGELGFAGAFGLLMPIRLLDA